MNLSIFDPNTHKVKYFCHHCNNMWFGVNQFSDLCPFCEGIDFSFSFITADDMVIYDAIKNTMDGFVRSIAIMKKELETLYWKDDDGLRVK